MKIFSVIVITIIAVLWFLDSSYSPLRVVKREDAELLEKAEQSVQQNLSQVASEQISAPPAAPEDIHAPLNLRPLRKVKLKDLVEVGGEVVGVQPQGLLVDCTPIEPNHRNYTVGASAGAGDSAAMARAFVSEQRILNDRANGPLQLLQNGSLVPTDLEVPVKATEIAFLAGLPDPKLWKVGDRIRVIAADTKILYEGHYVGMADITVDTAAIPKSWLFESNRKGALDK